MDNLAIVWFKTDLRLHDNEVLSAALRHHEQILPVYCFDPADYGNTPYGFKKTGPYRRKFILESVQALQESLQEVGSGLLVLRGPSAVEIPRIAQQYKAVKVYAKAEVAPYEQQTQTAVIAALSALGCGFESLENSSLYHPDDLPFDAEAAPEVFTTFRKKVEQYAAVRRVCPKPSVIHSPRIPEFVLPSSDEHSLEDAHFDPRSVLYFEGGEPQALQRLDHYLFKTQAISTYKATRNGLMGADYSSKFSPWLALGCISPRYIYGQIKEYELQFGANESTYWLVFELLWRDFFRVMMHKHHNRFFYPNGLRPYATINYKIDPTSLDKWVNGFTGVDFVDANMKELQLSGFMSNRGRQNVASYLCHDLGLDWRLGAAYFEQQLIDYDVCSNWCNWAYIAGVGNDPRDHRYFNIQKQATDYDRDGAYRRHWLAATPNIELLP